jgi:aspartate carbamoyltransferase catalytic subunit
MAKTSSSPAPILKARHLLGIADLSAQEISALLDLADNYANATRLGERHGKVLKGLTQINLFFENSTRTQSSFELAGKRLAH